MAIAASGNMQRGRFARAGRRSQDGLGQDRSLHSRDDDPAPPDADGDDDADEGDTETDTEDDDDQSSTPEPSTPPPVPQSSSSASNPTLSSSTRRAIPTLTAIAHSPTSPSSNTTARPVKTTSTSISVSFTTITTATNRQSSVTASLSVATAIVGSAALASVSGTTPISAMRAGESARPILDRPSTTSGLSPGAKAGIAFGVIAAVSLLAALVFLLLRRRRRAKHGTIPPPERPTEDASPANVRSQSAIIADMLESAYATQNGGAAPHTYPAEKTAGDASSSLPVSSEQPQIRSSIASWLRRHHPLDLNPLSGRSSTASSTQQRRTTTTINNRESFAAPPITPVVEITDHPRRQAAQKKDQTKFVSVWSDSTSSRGSSSIPSFYYRSSARSDSSDIRGTWVLPPARESRQGVDITTTGS